MKRVKSLISRFLGVDFEKANQNLLNEDVYFLRAKALDEKISNEELSKVILHILKRRGFRSNRIHSTDKEEGKLKTAISENEERMNKGGYRTIGEMLYKDEAYKVECCGKLVYNVRNHGGDYRNCFSRATLANELQIILEKQKELGNEKITDEFIEKIVYIFEKQRNFDEGPGAQSPYHFDEYEVGNCTFIPTEKRAPKASYTFELFNALSKINNLKIGAEFLTQEQRKELYDVVQTKPELKFKQIRKMFSVPNDKLFNLCNYKRSKKEQDISDDELIEKCENKVFVSMKRSYDIRKALGDVENFDADFVDAIALMCSMCKSDEKVDKYIAEKNFALSADQIDKIKALSGIEKFGSLSIKAMKKIILFLYDGERYDIACKHAGFDDASFEHEKTKYLKGKCVEEALSDVTNNVVKRAVNQSLRVLNKIIEIYGSPQFVNIELARDIAKIENRSGVDNIEQIAEECDGIMIGRGDMGVVIFSAALAGALLGFLRYNFNPAKVFMGDTGSLFLGGAVAGLAFACEMPLILLLVGLIYIIETLSVILQVTYFKATHGKRLFKMAPIHHHFEMCGWGEKKIVLVFTGITVVLCLLAYHVALAPLF